MDAWTPTGRDKSLRPPGCGVTMYTEKYWESEGADEAAVSDPH